MWEACLGCHVQLDRLHAAQGHDIERGADNITSVIYGYIYY